MSDKVLLKQIHDLDAEFERLTGRRAFGHVAAPTPTSLRITFADASVHLSYAAAYGHMAGLLHTAREEPHRLPWPLSEPVPELPQALIQQLTAEADYVADRQQWGTADTVLDTDDIPLTR